MIAAVVLAAGLSKRMGSPKMVLPWGHTTVIGQVVGVLIQCRVAEIVVVTGGARRQVENALKDLPVRLEFNPSHQQEEMTHSLKFGLTRLSTNMNAALVTLGDQPQIQPGVVKGVMNEYKQSGAPLIVPSYQMRRGHPWLVRRTLWMEIMDLKPPQTMRDFLDSQSDQIHYYLVQDDSVLRDLDTPKDYEQERPG